MWLTIFLSYKLIGSTIVSNSGTGRCSNAVAVQIVLFQVSERIRGEGRVNDDVIITQTLVYEKQDVVANDSILIFGPRDKPADRGATWADDK